MDCENRLDRRTIMAGLLAPALLASSGATQAAGHHHQHGKTAMRKPIIIAHRGASGLRPEHTLAAYQLAIDLGADFIEPDLVLTKDGHLICRHENEIGGTTDVANRPEFADRKKVHVIDGERHEGWFTEDFTLAEIKTLRCKERLPQLRPANTAYDGQFDVPTFEEVLALAKSQSVKTGRTIGVYPETKHPTWFEGLSLSFDRPLVSAIKAHGLDAADAPIFIQSFEVTNLKRLKTLTKAPLVQLMASEGGPFDLSAQKVSYASMATASGLVEIARYASGVGPEKVMIIPRDGANQLMTPTRFVPDAHQAGLVVHPWTFRAENYFLPQSLRKGDAASPAYLAQHGDLVSEIRAFMAAGVDGVFSDFTAEAVAARASL
ncbi:glycerophosphodiester phosphodiesterase, periplasmic [Candidatus Phycosocius bacilliformis]|uniref:glycerophosphodiester phosphodiesterase n=2 Tax=Candidatus Phycosocius bacilliformis TaxID=1445552 RepID=A0A2P2E831_9PROT|nr:glycerophosphodiester phosphodiesterase, periplasmic [Candidatus Phycosocius bacilliformis]